MAPRALPVVLALFSLGCSASLACGDGTTQVGDRCLPIVACGPGTIVMGDVCVPESMLVCGSGTIRMGDACVRDDLACPEGTIQRGETCLAADVVVVRIPFPAGFRALVGQGMHGGFSHDGASVHALDFPLPEGTTIAAARDGIVVDVREDSNSGCGDASCARDGNYVLVDHGDGTYGSYYHLQLDGALVDVGERVCAGEAIALSGNTGWSTGPHLHFQVQDAFGYSLPLWFEDLADVSDGHFPPALGAVSENAPPASCDHVIEPADCPPDLFAHDGIVDLAGMPCGLADRGMTYTITGRGVGTGRTGQLIFRGDLDADWSYECGTSNADGTFSVDLTFPATRAMLRAYVTIGGASVADCITVDGWDAAPHIRVR